MFHLLTLLVRFSISHASPLAPKWSLFFPQELTKDTILNLLKDRFKKEIVYTYVGDIVVSVNPFKNVRDGVHCTLHLYARIHQSYMYATHP